MIIDPGCTPLFCSRMLVANYRLADVQQLENVIKFLADYREQVLIRKGKQLLSRIGLQGFVPLGRQHHKRLEGKFCYLLSVQV